MPSLDASHRPSSHGVAIPKCAHCHKPGSVREVKLHDPSISPGIQYWRREVCGYLWVTLDGRAP
jgi:hypothetical protein